MFHIVIAFDLLVNFYESVLVYKFTIDITIFQFTLPQYRYRTPGLT